MADAQPHRRAGPLVPDTGRGGSLEAGDRVLDAALPGVVGHATDIIEHPELVAQRLLRFAKLVGAENVIAGTDRGLGNRVGHPEIVWAKLEDLSEGARIASRALFRYSR